MGFFVSITFSDYVIPAENVETAYQRFIELNDFDNAKRGGQMGGELSSRDPRPNGLNYHPSRWYSWMHPDYPDHYKNAEEILVALGFEIAHSEDLKSIMIIGYNDKTGQEDIFLDSIYDLTTGSIHWMGEDNTEWTTESGVFKNCLQDTIDFHTKYGSIVGGKS